MRTALLVLAVGAAAAGVLGISATTGLLPKLLTPVVGRTREAVAGPSELVLPGPLMQLRRMLKPDGLLSRLAHACGVMEPHPARAAKKRSIGFGVFIQFAA